MMSQSAGDLHKHCHSIKVGLRRVDVEGGRQRTGRRQHRPTKANGDEASPGAAVAVCSTLLAISTAQQGRG